MADRKKGVEDAAAEALLVAGKDAAKRAALDLLSSDEDRAAKQAEDARGSKRKRWKLIAGGVLGLFVLIGVIGMLLNYWQWFLLLGLAGLGGALGWWRIKRRLAAKRSQEPARIEVARRVEDAPGSRKALPRMAEEREIEESAVAETEATEQAIDDELAAMKARIKRQPGKS